MNDIIRTLCGVLAGPHPTAPDEAVPLTDCCKVMARLDPSGDTATCTGCDQAVPVQYGKDLYEVLVEVVGCPVPDDCLNHTIYLLKEKNNV